MCEFNEKKIVTSKSLFLQSALIDRVFLIAPLHDILRRNCLGRNVV